MRAMHMPVIFAALFDRRGCQARSGMRRGHRAAHGHLVAIDQRVLDGDADVRKGRAELMEEWPEGGGAADFLAVRAGNAVHDRILCHHLVDRTFALLVPDLLEPSMQHGFRPLCHCAPSLKPRPRTHRAARTRSAVCRPPSFPPLSLPTRRPPRRSCRWRACPIGWTACRVRRLRAAARGPSRPARRSRSPGCRNSRSRTMHRS